MLLCSLHYFLALSGHECGTSFISALPFSSTYQLVRATWDPWLKPLDLFNLTQGGLAWALPVLWAG